MTRRGVKGPRQPRCIRATAHLMVVALVVGATGAEAQARTSDGLAYSHGDWEVACDNTRTCRAAGYSADGDSMSVSVLLTRAAGAATPVTGRLRLGEYEESSLIARLPNPIPVTLRVDGRRIGSVVVARDSMVTALPAALVDALLGALRGTGRIGWESGAARWTLSGDGAMAVLLKMDEAQGRVGSTGALARPGRAGETRALPAMPAPVVWAAPVPSGDAARVRVTARERAELLAAITRTVDEEACPQLLHPESPVELEVVRLGPSHRLVSTPCWLAAYNAGTGFWVVGPGARPRAVLVTANGTDYEGGTIASGQKGRGLGDCWSSQAWTWDGTRFVLTSEGTTGMCRLVAPGGAWELPTRVSEVRPRR